MKRQYVKLIRAGNGGRGCSPSGVHVWLCKSLGCKTELNDLEYNHTRQYCLHHRNSRIKNRNQYHYRLRAGINIKNIYKYELILYLLKTLKRVSHYQIMGFGDIKRKETVNAWICYLRHRGYNIRFKRDHTNYQYGYFYLKGKKYEKE